MLGKHQQVSVTGGEPSHLILDAVQLVIFRTFHAGWALCSPEVANAERLFSRSYSCVHVKSKGSRVIAGLVPVGVLTARRPKAAVPSASG
jgi:hypothetical protein